MIFFSFLWVNLSLVTSYTLQVTLHILNKVVVHKATALVQHVQTDSMNTLLQYYSVPQNHVCPIYWEDKLSKLGTAFVPATQSCSMFPTAGRWSLNWSLDINIYNLPVETNITQTKSPLASAAPELRFGMSLSISWACTGQVQQVKDMLQGQECTCCTCTKTYRENE